MIRRTGSTSKYLYFLQTLCPVKPNSKKGIFFFFTGLDLNRTYSGHVNEMILQSVDAGQMKTALRVFSQCLTTHDIKLVLFV